MEGNIVKVLPPTILVFVFTEWLWDFELCCLDSAFSNNFQRSAVLKLLALISIENVSKLEDHEFQWKWIAQRKMGLRKIFVKDTNRHPCSLYLPVILTRTSRIDHLQAPVNIILDITKWNAEIVSVMLMHSSNASSLIGKVLRSLKRVQNIACSETIETDEMAQFLNELPDLKQFSCKSNKLASSVLSCHQLTSLKCFDAEDFVCNFQNDLESMTLNCPNNLMDSIRLNGILNNCPNVMELCVTSTKITDESFIPFVIAHPFLKKLDVSHCSVTDASLDAVGKHCRGMNFLNIDSCNVSDKGLTAIAKCQVLTELIVNNLRLISDTGLISVLSTCPLLTALRTEHTAITDASMEILFDNCRIRFLSVIGTKITSAFLVNRAKSLLLSVTTLYVYFSELRLGGKDCTLNLSVGSDNWSSELLAITMCCPMLTRVSIFHDSFSDDCLACLLVQCPQLRQLYLTGCSALTANCIQYISEATSKITKFWFMSSLINDSDISLLASSQKNLINLSLNYPNITNASLKYIANHCSKLRILSVYGNAFVSSVGLIEILRKCHDLRDLQFDNCYSLDGAFLLEHLRSGRYLRSIEMVNCDMVNFNDLKLFKDSVRSHQLGVLLGDYDTFHPM